MGCHLPSPFQPISQSPATPTQTLNHQPHPLPPQYPQSTSPTAPLQGNPAGRTCSETLLGNLARNPSAGGVMVLSYAFPQGWEGLLGLEMGFVRPGALDKLGFGGVGR